eukprot:392446-Amphidinium_carterae.1
MAESVIAKHALHDRLKTVLRAECGTMYPRTEIFGRRESGDRGTSILNYITNAALVFLLETECSEKMNLGTASPHG